MERDVWLSIESVFICNLKNYSDFENQGLNDAVYAHYTWSDQTEYTPAQGLTLTQRPDLGFQQHYMHARWDVEMKGNVWLKWCVSVSKLDRCMAPQSLKSAPQLVTVQCLVAFAMLPLFALIETYQLDLSMHWTLYIQRKTIRHLWSFFLLRWMGQQYL